MANQNPLLPPTASLSIATAKAIRTPQRLKSLLVLQSPPTRTEI